MSIKKTKEKGITLIALAITIIVILLLAGVTISTMQGNSGIISKANESKSHTERKEVIEKAKMTISEKVVDNGGNELTRSELKEILEKYFIEVPEDYTLETILKTKEENGKYEIKVSEIYDREFWGDDEETPDNPVTPPEPTPTNPTTQPTTSDTGGEDTSDSKEIDVTKVEMDKQTATVDINGENTVQLNAKVIPSNANKNTEITWISKKKEVASVNQKGLVTGKTVGNSMIMATSQNGYSADCLVVCQAKITGITINPVTANMTVGQKITLTATTSPEIVTEKVTWKSRNEDVAKVDNNGNVTGIGKGVVEIIAQNPGGTIQAVCLINVQTSPLGVTLNKNKITLDMSGTKTAKLIATINPYTANVNKDITWTSSNTDIAEVEDGLVTGISNGTVVITAMTANGKYAECIVEVQTSPTEVKLNYSSLILEKSALASPTLNATILPESANVNTNITWSSSNTSVVAVDNGKLAVKGNGSTTITVKTDNGCRSQCTIVIITSITSIEVSPTSKKMEVNQTAQLTAKVNPADATEKITWKSSNTDVAKVDRNGLVTGVAKGKAIITAQNPAGTIKATCTVTVGNATLMVARYGTGKDTDNYLRSNVAKNKIESIKFVKGQVPTSGIIEQFDATEAEDSSIIGYYTDEDSNDMYELTFVSETNIEANQNSSYLFYYLSNVKEIALDNFDTSQVTNMSSMFWNCRSLTSLDVSKFDTSKVTGMSLMFTSCRSLTSLDVSKFDTSQVTNMAQMFWECRSLTSLDVSKFDTSKVINMQGMFAWCENVISLDVSKFDISRVTNISSMFIYCRSLTSLDVSEFDTSKVTDMETMFYSCRSLTSLDVSKFDTSQVTNMRGMFSGCRSLTSLDVSNFDTSRVTDMDNMFTACEFASLDVSNFDTSRVTDMSFMFQGCKFASLDVSNFDTSRVTDMDSMFAECNNFISLDLSNFDTSQVTDMSFMFNGCKRLTSLDVSNFDTSQVTNMFGMFQRCSNFTSLNVSFDTSQVTNMAQMFWECSSLTSLDVSEFDTSKVINMRSMFADCIKLSKIYVSEYNETTGNGWTTKNVTDSDNMFSGATRLVGGNGTKFNSSYIDATYARIDKEGEPGYLTTDIGQASKTESYVGYYADVDGDGTVDGIIFADLLHGKTGQWGNSNGTYTIPTKESTKLKSYKVSQEYYTNQLGGTSKILTPSGNGNDRFYVMALTDITGLYVFGCSLSGTTTIFGSGKTNTQTLIGKADLNSSLKEQIQPKVNKGWFIPSKEELSAFGGELGITTSNYSAKGLNDWYWSSSQHGTYTTYAWGANFNNGYMYYGINGHVRLVTTF